MYGPYLCKDGRLRIIIDGKTKSYPRFLWESAYGKLPEDLEIHHKNKNPLDNKLTNLEVLSKKEHRKLHRKIKSELFVCPVCSKDFSLEGKRLSYSKSNRLKGKKGPFCSRSCAGKWSTY